MLAEATASTMVIFDNELSPGNIRALEEIIGLTVLDRSARTSALVIETDQHQVFGRMNGRAVLDDGTNIEVKDMMCFAEYVHNRY